MLKLYILLCVLLTAFSAFALPACRADLPAFTVLHTFPLQRQDNPLLVQDTSADAGRPEGPLTQGTDGAFYGTTPHGGAHGTGAIFKINSDGTGFTLLHSFSSVEETVNATNHDGSGPKGALVLSRGVFYGITVMGGPSGDGVVFKINQDGTGFAVLHSFDDFRNHDNSALPKGLTLGADGMLYGVTLTGGRDENGTLFTLSQDGKAFRVLHSFHPMFRVHNPDLAGLNPNVGFVVGPDGAFYGTTSAGGSQACGDVYKIDADGGHYTVLHSFEKNSRYSSAFPQGPLILGLDSFLYGCTRRGGLDNGGMVYKIRIDGTGFTVLHNFSAPDSENGDGTLPDGALVFGRDGSLYGVTSRGGSGEAGVLFRVSTDGRKFFALHDFSLPDHNLCNADGGLSFMGLTLGRDGNLYGVAAGGGANGTGTVFRVTFPAAE